jgi:hypothetical protein
MVPYQSVAGSLDHAVHLLEAIGSPVVRVGHLALLTGIEQVEQESDFLPMLVALRQAQHIADILVVHSKDVVEALEVFRNELAGALVGNVYAKA